MSSPMDYTRFSPPEHKEPAGVFSVEIRTGCKENYGWDLWEDDIPSYASAVKEARVVQAHRFEARIKDQEGNKVYDF